MTALDLVLVHSPLVGPDTWAPVADGLRRRGHRVTVPVLSRTGSPHWAAHTATVVEQVAAVDGPRRVVLVAHSGAGQLLGHIAEALRDRDVEVAAHVLVDAGVPTDGGSRLDQLRAEAPDLADHLDELLRGGGAFPDWGPDLLAPLVPDPDRRRRLLDGLRPQGIEYWAEPIPVVDGWPDAPCGVLLLSNGYAATAARARREGWPLHDLAADNHFLLLADPDAVGDHLRRLVDDLTG